MSDQQVERTEYRVAHDVHGSDETWELPLADPTSLVEARRRLQTVWNGKGARNGRHNFRIQKRTVTSTPWEDVVDA